ncbi:hypothetical protein [Wenzhouxiangella marina]|uniref:Uncharacterized protein n=1 Tax=Wenzhouxiangella marina TaxID=1579979 RepID=A0A0K0XX89_9GAMM|nr:hypothetical protein [Wenzhouxiangella marina]AKS42226.1 hypothetical protein WM2015_1859 [Wenzhouxiangella marina]MBB6086002.1 hypothetical protein [Wenzhouxiangella marina]
MFSTIKRNAVAFAVGSALIGSAQAFVVNEQFSGNYSEPDKGGRGFIIDVVPSASQEFGNGVLAQWFTYRDGQPLWLFAQGDIDQNTNVASFDILEITGGSFGPEFDGSVNVATWGTGTLAFNSCNSLTLSYDGVDGTGTQNLTPVTRGDDCIVDEAFSSCPAFSSGPGGIEGTCIIGGEIDGNVTLTNEITWLIQGQLFVGEGDTLTIEAGTELIGGTLGDTDTLVVRQGGKIFANGTANNPIVMRGPFAETRAEWGGVVINGYAPINGCAEGVDVCTAQGEGNSGTYGGNDPADNSGVLRYVVVSNAGRQFSEENELNGIAFQGVGNGTTVEYIQVHMNEDDGVEFFGGTVNAKYLVLTGIGDDSLDWTQGWTGNVQYVIAKQYTDNGDQGIEADNNGDANDALPRALPTLANMTFIGQSNTDIGWLLREGTGANIANSVVTGFGEYCIDIDQQSTFDNVANLTAVNSIAGGCDLGTFDDADGDSFLVSSWFLDQAGNVAANPMLSNYIPMAGSPALQTAPVPFSNAFFDNVDFAGAVRDASADWTKGWTVGLDRDAPIGQ